MGFPIFFVDHHHFPRFFLRSTAQIRPLAGPLENLEEMERSPPISTGTEADLLRRLRQGGFHIHGVTPYTYVTYVIQYIYIYIQK